MNIKSFKLSKQFVERYKKINPEFGFDGLGELVYMRTYSRIKDDGTNEVWWETVQRVVEGTYTMQKNHIENSNLGWNAWRAQKSAQEMYRRIFTMKFLPPGRGLWAMGTPITEERGLYAALNNCAFVSTKTLKEDLSKPFCFLMDASMLGVGVGFDVRGAEQIIIKPPRVSSLKEKYVVPDDREGWVESLKSLLDSYFMGTGEIEFDYSLIRAEGALIKGFGGVSSGAGPLKKVHKDIRRVLNGNIDDPITITTIVDIMNLIGTCVVAGNVRRSAEIVFGEATNDEYINLKNYEMNPEREEYGWTSNNSVFANVDTDYSQFVDRICDNGEPGIFWLDNARKYGRMSNGPDNKDFRADGTNPCAEQVLESYELCCLVETFPDRHESLDDFLTTLKYAYLYAKTVTLGKTQWSDTNRVMLRNRRIGCSVSGVAQFISHQGLTTLKKWLDVGYNAIKEWDEKYSDWFAIPKSIRVSSVKPSGTISLLAGATPGIHYPESRFYIRRIRLSNTSKLLTPLKRAGYVIEPAFGSEDSTVVVEIPIDVGEGVRTLDDVGMYEQLSLAAFMQKYWSDNSVSCTITFDRETEGPLIEQALNYFQYQLKSVSFLPKLDNTTYKQMPYEHITEDDYNTITKKIKKLNFKSVKGNEAEIDRFCTTDYCELGSEISEIKSTQNVGKK